MRDLAIDTRVPFRNLHYALSFRETYRRLPTLALSWGHYRLLLDRPDAATRAHYQKLAVDEALSVHALASRIASDRREVSGNALLSRPHKPSFLYRAVVVNVIDGDTLDLRVDLGFFTKHEGRFRLAGIDCAELNGDSRTADTNPGRAARDFVFNRLATANTTTGGRFTNVEIRVSAHFKIREPSLFAPRGAPLTASYAPCSMSTRAPPLSSSVIGLLESE